MATYNRLRRNERKGLITQENAEVRYARITNSLLALLEELPQRVSSEMSPVAPPQETSEELTIPAEVSFEKILGVNNLKQISWIGKGIRVARSVCRILTQNGLGTGFLVAQDLLMTNNHVIPSPIVAEHCVAEFNYEQDFQGDLMSTCRYRLDSGRFHTSQVLDYTLVGIVPDPSRPPLTEWGHLQLNANADPVPGEHVIIIQHPNGGLKQIALTANQVASLWEYRLHYTTDTMPGSSGSPVFNDLWQVIALHHAGGELQVNAKGDKRFINEGILMSAIRSEAGNFWPQ
jgi:V8-like Glu-specific endopeptidase